MFTTALATLIVGIISAIVTIGVNYSNNENTREAEERQNEYNKEAMELQNQYNKEAAAQSYEYETNYQDRMNKLMSTGITSWKAADILGGSSTAVQPTQVQVNQALKKDPADMSPLMSILGQVPSVASSMEDRKLKKEQQDVDNQYKERELDLRERAIKVQEDLANHKITREEALDEIYNTAQNWLVTDPTNPDGPKIPLFLASALSNVYIQEENYKQEITATSMSNEQLTEFKKQVNRNETLFNLQVRSLNDAHKISEEEYNKIKDVVKILDRESSPDWLEARFQLLNAQKLRAMEGQEINSIIDGLDVSSETKGLMKFVFQLLKSIFDR